MYVDNERSFSPGGREWGRDYVYQCRSIISMLAISLAANNIYQW